MKRIVKDFLVTAGLVVALVVLFLLAKGISMIPIESIWGFLKQNWIGILIGIVICYIGKAISEICFAEKEEEPKNVTSQAEKK